MNSTNDQLAAIQAIRNADERQLQELVATLATCAGGPLTLPPARPSPAARKILRAVKTKAPPPPAAPPAAADDVAPPTAGPSARHTGSHDL